MKCCNMIGKHVVSKSHRIHQMEDSKVCLRLQVLNPIDVYRAFYFIAAETALCKVN